MSWPGALNKSLISPYRGEKSRNLRSHRFGKSWKGRFESSTSSPIRSTSLPSSTAHIKSRPVSNKLANRGGMGTPACATVRKPEPPTDWMWYLRWCPGPLGAYIQTNVCATCVDCGSQGRKNSSVPVHRETLSSPRRQRKDHSSLPPGAGRWPRNEVGRVFSTALRGPQALEDRLQIQGWFACSPLFA